jgi:hypothetical protein
LQECAAVDHHHLVLSLQLSRSPEEFDRRLGTGRDGLRSSLRIDFGFIAAYWLVFATTSALFAVRSFWGADWLGVVAGETATLGAIGDVSENVYTLRLLRRLDGEAGDDDPGGVAAAMRTSSRFKWTSLFAATALLSVMFFVRGGWSVAVGVLYAAPAALGLASMGADALGLPVERPLRAAFYGQCAALAVGLPIAASQI